jgi:glutathione S-transferase
MPIQAEDLALYYDEYCPYCMRVLRTLRALDVQLELRNVRRDPQHLRELVAARGRGTVPVLRIHRAEGDEWMPESADIIAYLERRFGRTG